VRWAKVLAVVSLSRRLDNLLFTLQWSNTHVLAFQILDVVFTTGFSVVELFQFVIIATAFEEAAAGSGAMVVAAAAFVVEMYDVVQHTALQRSAVYATGRLASAMTTPCSLCCKGG